MKRRLKINGELLKLQFVRFIICLPSFLMHALAVIFLPAFLMKRPTEKSGLTLLQTVMLKQ